MLEYKGRMKLHPGNYRFRALWIRSIQNGWRNCDDSMFNRRIDTCRIYALSFCPYQFPCCKGLWARGRLRLRTVASPLHFHIHYRLRKVRIYRQSSAGSQKQTINGMKKGLRLPKYRRHPLSFPLLLILVAFSVRMNSHQ